MPGFNKKDLTETDIRTKFITPALDRDKRGRWDVMTQIREETYFTKGRVMVRGKSVARGERKRADNMRQQLGCQSKVCAQQPLTISDLVQENLRRLSFLSNPPRTKTHRREGGAANGVGGSVGGAACGVAGEGGGAFGGGGGGDCGGGVKGFLCWRLPS